MQFVETVRRDTVLREQGVNLAECTEEMKIKTGRLLGAQYMLTGSLTRSGIIPATGGAAATQNPSYRLTMEVTELKTGLVVLRKPIVFTGKANQPLSGFAGVP